MENREGSSQTTRNMRNASTVSRIDRRRAEQEAAYASTYKQCLDPVNIVKERSIRGTPPHMKEISNLRSSRKERETSLDFAGDRLEGFLRDSRTVTEHGRICRYTFPDVYKRPLPSNYYELPHSSGCSGLSGGRSDRVEELERDRAELLMKLDELRTQIGGSSSSTSKHKEMVPVYKKIASPDPCYDRATYYASDCSLADRSSPGKPQNMKYSHCPVPSVESYEMHMRNLYISPRVQNYAPEDQQQFWPGSMRTPSQYTYEPPWEYLPEQYVGFDREPSLIYPNESALHHSSCSCLSCSHSRRRVPPQVSPLSSSSRKIFGDQLDPNLHNRVNPVRIQPRYHIGGIGAGAPLVNSQDPFSRERQSQESYSDVDNVVLPRQRSKVVFQRNKKHCHPIAGAAPFVLCLNCFELLELPKRIITKKSRQLKLKCGGCLSTISFEFENKKIMASKIEESLGPAEGRDETLIYSSCSSPARMTSDNQPSVTEASCSPYDDPQQKVTEENSLAEEQLQDNASQSERGQGHLLPTSVSHSDRESPDSAIVHKNVLRQSENDPSQKLQSPHATQQSSDSSFDVKEINSRMNPEDVSLEKNPDFCRTHNIASAFTDVVEVPFSEYLDTSLSQGSADTVAEENEKLNRKNKSFLAGLIKSHRESPRSHQNQENEKPKVTVNGHPIPDNVVKMAEKLAGPVLPGNYWYDFNAGFWGVMSEPCLGIIPPFIEEFKYPMPANCDAGNTGVHVNGRELHESDLDLLASRGLPSKANSFYAVNISGNVFDEKTHEKICNLGKLAPTVMTAKRGFGMRAPEG